MHALFVQFAVVQDAARGDAVADEQGRAGELPEQHPCATDDGEGAGDLSGQAECLRVEHGSNLVQSGLLHRHELEEHDDEPVGSFEVTSELSVT